MKLEIHPRASLCILLQCRNAILLSLAKNYPVSGQILEGRMPNYLKHHVLHWRTVSISEKCHSSLPFSYTVMSDSATPWTAAYQASQSFTISRSLLKLMSIESVMPSNHLVLCHPLLFLPSIFLSIRVFSKESVLCMRWPKYWSLSFSMSPSNEYSGLIYFRIDWFDLLVVSLLNQNKNKSFSPWKFHYFMHFHKVEQQKE